MTKYGRGYMRALLLLREQRGLSIFPFPHFLFLSLDIDLSQKERGIYIN